MRFVKILSLILLVLVLLVAAALLLIPGMNDFKTSGALKIKGLESEMEIIRDENGMAHIKADNLTQAIWGQGFAMAQDRLFQMQLNRLMAQGRISELAGAKAIPLDTRNRRLGFERAARKHAAILSDSDRAFFKSFVKGVNTFIEQQPGQIPLEFKMAGLKPEKWEIKDSLSILYYMAWQTSADMKTELTAMALVEKVGLEKARELFPLNINPDAPEKERIESGAGWPSEGSTIFDEKWASCYGGDQGLSLGSNNWAVSGERSRSGKPILANDPHLDSRMLPGPWYPSGLITPESRMVGVTIAGIPGIIVGRNDHVALGVTNAYADVQDLFIEKVDPDNPENFLEGTESLPFGKIQETLKIRDKSSESGFRREKITIRTTNRGPVISDPGGYFPKGSVVTVRWAALESMAPEIGIKRIMSAGSVEEVDSALAGLTMLALNFVFADNQGNIGWRVSGKIPVRDKNNSPLPVHVTDSRDNWKGWIPFELNPHSFNPERGWVGTCNHYTPEPDYPYYYTAHAAPTGRYLRLKELMRDQTRKGPEDHWAFQRDTINPPARELTPVFLSALKGDERFDQIVDILEKWDFSDRADSQGALIFHYMDENFAQLVFQDELGEQVSSRMLNNWYFWRERFLSMIRSNDSSWFDDKNTPNVVETRDEMIRKAAIRTINELSERFGPDPHGWNWGKAHVVEFVNPLRRSGFGKELFGAESFEMAGSVDTLYRAMYEFGEPTPVTITASLRMVADLGDKDKVMAVIPGGVAARTFHEHFNDQLKDFMTGAKLYWPFSDKGIKEHSVETLKLTPAGN